jgi:hypothetical protein
MNLIYYIVGAFTTFIGIIIYRLVSNNGVYTLSQASLMDVGIISLVAGVAFFAADWLMSKTRSS